MSDRNDREDKPRRVRVRTSDVAAHGCTITMEEYSGGNLWVETARIAAWPSEFDVFHEVIDSAGRRVQLLIGGLGRPCKWRIVERDGPAE